MRCQPLRRALGLRRRNCLAELENNLLGTVWGVVLLGAFGSLLGAVLLWFCHFIVSYFPEVKTRFRWSIINFIGFEIELAEEVEKQLLSNDKQVAFLAYNSDTLQKLNHRFLLFLSVCILTFFVYVSYSISRPLLLSFLIALVIILFAWYFKLLLRYKLYMQSLGFEDIENKVHHILLEQKQRSVRIAKLVRKARSRPKP